jgi:hypothetical protein
MHPCAGNVHTPLARGTDLVLLQLPPLPAASASYTDKTVDAMQGWGSPDSTVHLGAVQESRKRRNARRVTEGAVGESHHPSTDHQDIGTGLGKRAVFSWLSGVPPRD